MTADDQLVQGLGYVSNFVATAFAILVKCLKANGALSPGQFEDELRATIKLADDPGRLDYVQLKVLLDLVEGTTPRGH